MPLNKLKSEVKSLLDSSNLYEVLNFYTRPSNVDFLKTECLEILVEAIAEAARKNLGENKKFSFESFICTKCCDIIRDPVTLKCGHTFSKKCMLSEVREDSFLCPKCGQKYTFSYLSQMKNSVAILSLVEKLHDRYFSKHLKALHENRRDKTPDVDLYLFNGLDNGDMELPSSIFLNATSSGLLKKANLLLNLRKYREAFKAYLTCFTLDPNALHAKRTCIQVLHGILQNYPCSVSHKFNSVENSGLVMRTHSLRSSGSCDSLHTVEDDRSSDEEETKIELNKYSDRTDLYLMLEAFFNNINKIKDERSILSRIDVTYLDKQEFECPLCMRLLWEPVTTTCGHTFCRVCLNRCFDHQPTCPLCKASLAAFLAERVQNTTELLESAIKNLFPTDYIERKAMYMEEMEQLINAGKDLEHEIPLFVCTVALPTVPCPLHVFEPRYRLMIRQCMESGSRQFGMCGLIDDEIAEYGTILEIREVQYFPDGRSIIDTVGRKRFRIHRKGERDGYHTGAVEFLEDQPLNDVNLEYAKQKHEQVYKLSKIWLKHLPEDTHHQILQHFGPMPSVEADYTSIPDGPSWLWWMVAILPIEMRLKVLFLSLRSLLQRLEFVYRILLHFQSTLSS